MEQKCNLVMLVDDDMTDTFIATRIISITGFAKDIIVKNTVREALKHLKDNDTDAVTVPDIIFLDLNMPVLSGFDFLNEFESLSNTVKDKCKIIILSSSDNKPDIQRILSIDQVIKFITKPISEEVLEEIHLRRVSSL